MSIIATILTGNCGSLIANAIGSVGDWGDRILLIDTGITDATLNIARDLAGAKLLVEQLAWCNDFSQARNFALARAAALGASWALTVDTDERLSFPGFQSADQLRRALNSDPNVLVWLVPCRDGSYAKERFIRVPTQLVWKGRTHEALVGATERQRRILHGVEFFEEPKTPEQFRAKLHRDLEILRIETREQPDNPRWWYYLGQTLQELAEHREAAEAYRQCYERRDGWAEQAAWACFRAATCWLRLNELVQALEICALGLARQPQSPELAWLAGFCSFKLGHFANAVAWEEIAIALGHFEGNRAGQQRISFRYLPGWYEGPYDVLRFAWRALGQTQRADECERKFIAAQAKRGQHGTGPAESAAGVPAPVTILGPVSARPATSLGETRPRGFATGDNAESPHRERTIGVRVAVLGLYSSGSTAVAGLLHHLGVCLGRQFWGDYFEARWLSDQLRRWWNEPDLREVVAREQRVGQLAQWLHDMESTGAAAVGAKHPLLVLCGDDLQDAWGGETKFLWAWRPLDESIASLERRGWWPGKERAVQNRLWEVAAEFFARQEHLQIVFNDLLQRPEREMGGIIEFLGLRPSEARKRAAANSIRRQA